jgi:hypothetical protein
MYFFTEAIISGWSLASQRADEALSGSRKPTFWQPFAAL